MERPPISKNLDRKTFLSFYYLKEELVDFCRNNHLPVSGGKAELTERICCFLDTGLIKEVNPRSREKHQAREIKEDSVIETDFICSEKHRAFFMEKIGKNFTFNVQFQKWLKNNSGKTYSDAITAYYEILKAKKNTKTSIDKQFEYNTYIRDFFEHNKGKSLDDAIICWKYKKQLQGHNRYEKSDLIALNLNRKNDFNE